MAAKSELTRESFAELLSWLDPNPDAASRKYNQIHQALTKILCRWKCNNAEELADETITRVAAKVQVIRQTYKGTPQRYFFGVAKKVWQEHQRHTQNLTTLDEHLETIPGPEPTDERLYKCFENCMEKLSPRRRELVGLYYRDHTAQQRERLAEHLGTVLATLRVRVFRIVQDLRTCVSECMNEGGDEMKEPE